MSKRPLGHGDIRGMKDFKALAMDYAYYLSLGEEGSLYCLTDRQIYILLAQLDYVGWLTRWYNTDDITQTTVQEIRSELELALLSCVDVSVLVDQANENLITTVTNRAIQSQALRDALELEYDGSPTSINPSAPTTTFSYGGSDDGNNALCASLMAFVYQFARAQADSVRAGQVGGLAAVALVAALLIPGLNVFFAVGAAIAVLLGLGTIGVSTETAIQALTDTDALNEVVCFMRDTLEGAGVSEANWSSCLDSYPFGVGTHAAIVADFLKASLASNYLPFLDIIGTGFDGVTDGIDLPECPCEDPPLDPTIFPHPTLGSFTGEPYTFLGFSSGGAHRWELTFQTGSGVTAIAVTFGNSLGISQCVHIVAVTGATSYQHNLCAGGTVSGAGGGASPTVEYGQLGWFGSSGDTTIIVEVEAI